MIKMSYVAALKKVLTQALVWFFLHKSMTNMSKTPYIHLDQIPFMPSLSADLFNPVMFMPSDGTPRQRLKTVKRFDDQKEK